MPATKPLFAKRSRRLQHLAGVLILSCGAAIAPVHATPASEPESAGWCHSQASLPDYLQSQIPQARRLGQGEYRWWGLSLYQACLWSPVNLAEPASWPGFALELRYSRALQGKRIAEASLKEIRQLGLGNPQQHQLWLEKMTAIFPDVQTGEQLSALYLPGKGLQFFRNQQKLTLIEDLEFAQAFLSIWLDPRTSAPELRKRLLGQATKQGVNS